MVTNGNEISRTGGCACGAVRFTAQGGPLRTGLCHCTTCRKAHAAAFNPFTVFRRDQISLTGALQVWRSSPGYERHFCPACGSRVVGFDLERDEAELSFGSFDETGWALPQYETWIIRREPWLLPLSIPQHDGDRHAG